MLQSTQLGQKLNGVRVGVYRTPLHPSHIVAHIYIHIWVHSLSSTMMTNNTKLPYVDMCMVKSYITINLYIYIYGYKGGYVYVDGLEEVVNNKKGI